MQGKSLNIDMSYKDYSQEIKKKLMEELKIKNIMALPKVIKIVVNVGVGEAVTSKDVLSKVQEQMSLITGQRPVITKAKKSVSAFKIREGQPIGIKVTLRGKKMNSFLEKLIKIVIPRMKDFRGLPETNIDQHGNLNIGFPEQTIFPEIEFDKVDKIRGLQVTVVTDAKKNITGKRFFEMLGVPFKK